MWSISTIFFKNTFGAPDGKYMITKNWQKTIEVLLNEILTTDSEQNEKVIQDYIENKQIRLE